MVENSIHARWMTPKRMRGGVARFTARSWELSVNSTLEMTGGIQKGRPLKIRIFLPPCFPYDVIVTKKFALPCSLWAVP